MSTQNLIIKAVIPARANSIRCTNKNTKIFSNGLSLMEIKINQLKNIKKISEIIVNSNDKLIEDICKKQQVRYIKRDDYYCTSSISINDVYENIAQNFDGDIIVYCNCTNPMIKTDTISKCLDLYLSMDINKYQSINTSFKLKNFIWYNNKPINYQYNQMPRSQDLPNYVSPNFAVNIISKKEMIKNKQIISKNPYFYNINSIEGYDIDTEEDFLIAQCLYDKINHSI